MNALSIRALIIALVIGTAGIVSTYYLSITVSGQLKEQSFLKLENIAKQVSIRFQDAVDTSMNDLQALQAFYSANNQHLSQTEFNKYMDILDISKRHYIQALSWVPLVKHDNRDNFEKTVRLQQANFNITARSEAGKLIQSLAKPYYTPVTYISPYEVNKAAQGFDLNSSSTRRTSLEYARDNGEMTTTAQIRLVQEKETSIGFLIIAPVYQQNVKLTNVAERRQALIGYVTGVFRIDTLMLNARSQADKERLELTLLDIDQDNGGVLYGEVNDNKSFSYDIAVPDRSWQLNIALNKALVDSIESPSIITWLLGAGALVSVLLAIAIFALQISIIRARRISGLSEELSLQNDKLEVTVAERTKMLAQRNNQLNCNVEELTKQRQTLSELMEESKVAKDHAEQRARDLTRTNKDLDDFAYVASHDLKAPLRGIDQLASWVVEDVEEGNYTDVSKHLKMMRNRVQRLEVLLNDLLVYSRANRHDNNVVLVNCSKLVDELFSLISPPEGFSLTISGDMPEFFTVSTPFEQVIRNFLSNAIKHHDKSAGNIEFRCEEQGDFYLFSIQDDGPGIKQAYYEDIFKMFKTLKPRDEIEGSGMGLALIKKTVEHYGGNVEVKSVEGQGSTFCFSWPKRIIGSSDKSSKDDE